jgi:hypothetical protein
MDVKEWMSYKCSDEGTCTQNIHNLSTRSHPSEEENRARNRSKNCKCKQAFTQRLHFCHFTSFLVPSFGEMNGDISNAEVALAKAQAVAVAAKNRQTPVPMATGMPPQISLPNNTNAVTNQTLPMSSKPPNMPQQGMMHQPMMPSQTPPMMPSQTPPMMPSQTPPMQTHNIGKSPHNAGNISQSPHMSPQRTTTPRQSPGPSIANKPVAAAHSQMQNPQTPNAATPQPTNSQTPGSQTPPKVSHRLSCFTFMIRVSALRVSMERFTFDFHYH